MSQAESLEAAVRDGDLERIRGLLSPLSEDERQALRPTVRAIMDAKVKEGVAGVGSLGPMLVAAYGTLLANELRKLGWRSIHIPDGLDEVLRGRSPDRLGPIIELLLEVAGGRAWYPVRALVRDGVVPSPDSPGYIIALLAATQYRRAADLVAEDPGVLEDEAWRLFEVEGGGEFSLAGFEKYTGDSWGDLFRHLATSDAAMRTRLLDASLTALARDFGTFRAGWFSRFHESLEPTDDERADRVSSYSRLLRSRTRPTVSFAVTALTRVSMAGRLEAEVILGTIEPVLEEAPAGTARSALKLVGRAGSDHRHARRAAVVATTALGHPSADVQRAALKLIDALAPGPDEIVAQALADQLEDVAASQRDAAEATLARLGNVPAEMTKSKPEPEGATDATEPARLPHQPPAMLQDARRITPLGNTDELIDVAVSVIESGEPPEDVERVLEAVGRMPADRSEAFVRTTAALARRCRAILDRQERAPFRGSDARADVAAVLWSWATGQPVSPGAGGHGEAGAGAFLSARAAEFAEAAGRGVAFGSVAMPTHVGGWIDPPALVARLMTGQPASRLDLVAALLRLAPGHRTEALATARDLGGEVGSVVRYALGGDERIGPTAPWWVAAARTRTPGEDDRRLERRHPGLGPDAGLAARVTISEGAAGGYAATLVLVIEPELPRAVDAELPTVHLFRGVAARSWTVPAEASMLRWLATIQPSYREAWSALGSVVMGRNIDWWSAEWANRVYLEPFTDPLTALGPQAVRLLGITLGAREEGERGLAGDVVRLALADGRLTPGDLAAGLTAAAAIDCDRPARWAGSLAAAAADSRPRMRAVASAIGDALPAIVARPPAALVPMLRLLDELLAATHGVPSGLSLEPLRTLAGRGGQTGRLARSILERTD